MKYILSLSFLTVPLAVKAQFVVGSSGLTVQSGTILSVDGLVLHPTDDLTMQDNEWQRSNTAVPAGNGNSIERVYLFSNAVNYSGTVSFHYEDHELGGNTESGLNLLYSESVHGNDWISGSGGVVDTGANYIYAMVQSAPVMRITAAATAPLPVTLLDFTARKDAAEEAALLEWEVAEERNCKAYIVERSSDAGSFFPIATVPATGSRFYHSVDGQPLEGKNFYRLKVIDMDGSHSYGHVAVLTFDKVPRGIYIYPNPVTKGRLTIAFTDRPAKDIAVTVVNMNGRVMHVGKLGGKATEIDVSTWSPGTYLIKMDNGKGFRFVKQ